MEPGREVVDQVIYETCQHAAGHFTSVFSEDEGRSACRSGLLSYLSIQGAKQLKQKWNEYWRPREPKRRMLLFVSHDGENIALAFQNQLVILQMSDDYVDPCGTYVGHDKLSFFTHGAWLEPQGILGVIDDLCTFYLINSNGSEITRSSLGELKLTAPIIDLFVLDNFSKKFCRSAFGIFTADGLVYSLEVSKDSREIAFRLLTLSNPLKNRSPRNVACLDIHSNLSLIVLIDAIEVSGNHQALSGSYSLCILRLSTNSDLELVFRSPQFEGLFSFKKYHLASLTSPKVSISPQGKYIATLDMTGCINVFQLDFDTLSILSFTERLQAHCFYDAPQGRKMSLHSIIDISWWSDGVLILVDISGYLTMYDVFNNKTVLKDEPHFCSPIIEGLKHLAGHAFVLEGGSCAEGISESEQTDSKKGFDKGQLYDVKVYWNLQSISGRSVLEMYHILICNKQYNSALEFADRHDLGRDELFKAQWLSSCYGYQDVDLFLSKISDRLFVLSECVDKVGQTEDAVKALLSLGIQLTEHFSFSNLNDEELTLHWDFRVARLQLLQYRDKLDTFVGINMGRFSAEEYSNFRVIPVKNIAVNLAESGKIGALNLIFKRHPYSLSQDNMHILSAIPETVPVQSYVQLLPGKTPAAAVALRERDWVECERMITFLNNMPCGSEKVIQVQTEYILKHSMGFVWPSNIELVDWYISRAKDIDVLSGQLENCIVLVDSAYRKGILELQHFLEDVTFLQHLIYADGCSVDCMMSLVEWERLADYEKFKMLLKGVTLESAVETLQEKAIPFMQKRLYSCRIKSLDQKNDEIGFMQSEQNISFLVRWMKEIASSNSLDICLKVIENGCQESQACGTFKDETELKETALECIYLCTHTDQWNVMASILSTLPRKSFREKTSKDIATLKHGSLGSGTPRFSYIRSHLSKSAKQSNSLILHEEDSGQHFGGLDHFVSSVADDDLEKRIKIAEGHVEVGRLMADYQVPKPIRFFLGAESDEKNVKQILRLILSKFGRRQPGRSDDEWTSMWRHLLCFQEKAFPFLDLEYMLIEFCRGLLKAGKFSFARNYLEGTGTISLEIEKAESLVVHAAREFFFSASSLNSSEICKARECLNLFPNSKVVQLEVDIVEALTVRLPNLGVTLLPVQFRQIKNPIAIIDMVLSSKTGACDNDKELIEVAKLLGLRSPDDVAAVEEAIARVAAENTNLQLASELCLLLANKGHGPIWDLCAAIGRNPNMDILGTSSKKQLLGFALSHCDGESIGELLNAWKAVDMRLHWEHLMLLTKTLPVNFVFKDSRIVSLPVNNVQDILNLRIKPETISTSSKENEEDVKVLIENLKNTLSEFAECSIGDGNSWDSLLRENWKLLSFCALELPWLLDLSCKGEYDSKETPDANASPGKYSMSSRFQALISILNCLAENDLAPKDELLISLAKSIMAYSRTEESDVLGCSYLLNLFDAFHGVKVMEEQLNQREAYHEIYRIMNIGMLYSSIQNLQKDCSGSDERRKLLHQKFREKYPWFGSDKLEQIDQVHSTFWREWKKKIEDQKLLADQIRLLEETFPGVDADRFLSGDNEYIKGVVFSFIDSVKTEKRCILKETVSLADMYGLPRMEVILRFFGSVLVSELWGNDEILTEVSFYQEDIAKCADRVIEMISTRVFSAINGNNKHRLAYVYSILSACWLCCSQAEVPASSPSQHHPLEKHIEPFRFYKVLEQECLRVSFIIELDFKNIARIDELNYDSFNEEILSNIHESTVEALADMTRSLVGMFSDASERGLISWQDVHKHYVLSLLASLESQRGDGNASEEYQVLLGEIDLKYDLCKKYISGLPEVEMLNTIKRFQMLCIPCISFPSITNHPGWKQCLITALHFWIKLAEDNQITKYPDNPEKPIIDESLPDVLKLFVKLVMEGHISVSEGWCIIHSFAHQNETAALSNIISSFFEYMVISGCSFNTIANAYLESNQALFNSRRNKIQASLLDLYSTLTETALSRISHGFSEHRKLHRLLSSLSKMTSSSHDDDLKAIRSEVWRKLSAFSDNSQLEYSMKVYALELMQCLTGGQNCRSFPDSLISDVEPWEDCAESCQSKTTEAADGGTNITSTLIALKSSWLINPIMPYVRITAENLCSLDSAVSCFLNLCESAISVEDIDVLKVVLENWEVLYSCTVIELEASNSSLKENEEWNNDDWDEGWETLPDELINEESKEKHSQLIRPLHACWAEIIRRLISLSRHSSVMEILDASSSKSAYGILLDEDEAKSLFYLIVKADCFMALKILLLLPYEALWSLCLREIEVKLRESWHPDNSNDDEYELLIIVLSSGALQTIISNPFLDKFFSYLCYIVGHLAGKAQEKLLPQYRYSKSDGPNWSIYLIFSELLFPCFVSELVQAKHFVLAGFMVSRWTNMHPSIGIMDIVETSLRKYLESWLLVQSDHSEKEGLDAFVQLQYSLSRLRSKLSSLVQTALLALSTNI